MTPILVATYGTLRRGEGNHSLLGDSEFLGTTKTEPRFDLLDNGWYPFMCEGGSQEVVIEVFRVKSEEILRRLYRLEGFNGKRGDPNNFYETIDIPTEFGEAQVFVVKEKPRCPRIESGDWLNKK